MLNLVILGQSEEVFSRHGFTNLREWLPVSARARRRRCYYDGNGALACFIASRSDIEDVIPALTAYQIEWNKIHDLLKVAPDAILDPDHHRDGAKAKSLAEYLAITVEDYHRLLSVWGDQFLGILRSMKEKRSNFRLRLLSGSLNEYRRATQDWWAKIETEAPNVLSSTRVFYFQQSPQYAEYPEWICVHS